MEQEGLGGIGRIASEAKQEEVMVGVGLTTAGPGEEEGVEGRPESKYGQDHATPAFCRSWEAARRAARCALELHEKLHNFEVIIEWLVPMLAPFPL